MKCVTLSKIMLTVVMACGFAGGCVTTDIVSTDAAATQPKLASKTSAGKNIKGMPGISGMAASSDGGFLVVHDVKAHKTDKPRLGLLTIDHDEEKVRYSEVSFPANVSPTSNDLEGACSLPGRTDEFLISESGTYELNYGRLFHIRLNGHKTSLISENKLPFTRDNNADQKDGDQFEGLACVAKKDGSILVLLGERGGTVRTPMGVLRWGVYDPKTGSIAWDSGKIEITAPNSFNAPNLRSLTALDVDAQGELYAAASVDANTDLGPFRSLVYRVGMVVPDQMPPVVKADETQVWELNGFKVEGVETHKGLSIGSEDENFGGVWRPLP